MTYPQWTGQMDSVLGRGRITYGGDGTNFFPIRVDAYGHIVLGASTAAAGTVAVSATKTSTDILETQLIAASTTIVSTARDVNTTKKMGIYINHGRGATVAFGTQGTEYRIEYSNSTDGPWFSMVSVTADSAACSSVRTGTALAVGNTTWAIVSTTTMVNGDMFSFANTTNAASSEWGSVITVTGTASIGVLDGLANIQASTEVMYTGAENFVLTLDTEAAQQMRLVVNNNNSGTTQPIYHHSEVIYSE